MSPRHRWNATESMSGGFTVQRCGHCGTERVRAALTKSLYLYRRGHALVPGEKKLGEHWRDFEAGFVPRCVVKAVAS